ncbi:MAG: alkaline phosphatase family protein [Planctomycetaceae bacterium]|nr:alkaline phosphatase family protein [Planctomycetaceae bacterium]
MRCVVLLALCGWVFGSSVDAADPVPASERCVILISVDGLANFYLDDPKAHLPTLRAMAQDGARAEGLVCSFPTVTWPNHTTLVTGVPPGKHGVIGNNYLDRNSGEKIALIPDPVFDKAQIVKVPTIYDVAHRQGLVTAGIIWPATRNARSLDFTVPDMFGNDSWSQFGTKAWLDELRAEGLPVDEYGRWVKEKTGGVQRDWLYARMAENLLQKHSPNLIMIHLVEVDHVQHRVGPKEPDSYWSVSYADSIIQQIQDAAENSKFKGKTTFVIASDHGFFPIEKNINANVVLKQEGLLDVKDGNTTKRAYAVAQGGGCMIYLLDVDDAPTWRKKLKARFAEVEGVQKAFTPDQFAEIGHVMPTDDSRQPDLWLAAKKGYSFSESTSGDEAVTDRGSKAGTHGFLPDQPDMLGTLVMWGYGIKPGTNLGKVPSLDVAPTMAELLGVSLPSADGKPLTKALQLE